MTYILNNLIVASMRMYMLWLFHNFFSNAKWTMWIKLWSKLKYDLTWLFYFLSCGPHRWRGGGVQLLISIPLPVLVQILEKRYYREGIEGGDCSLLSSLFSNNPFLWHFNDNTCIDRASWEGPKSPMMSLLFNSSSFLFYYSISEKHACT